MSCNSTSKLLPISLSFIFSMFFHIIDSKDISLNSSLRPLLEYLLTLKLKLWLRSERSEGDTLTPYEIIFYVAMEAK